MSTDLVREILEGRSVREAIASGVNEAGFSGPVQDIDVETVMPDQKDWDRAVGLRFNGSKFHGDNSPWAVKAKTMANAIKDPMKLVRRAKAVRATYGSEYDGDPESDVYAPFRDALIRMGFDRELQVPFIDNFTRR